MTGKRFELALFAAILCGSNPSLAAKGGEPDGYNCTAESDTELGHFVVATTITKDGVETQSQWQGYQDGALYLSALWHGDDLTAGSIDITLVKKDQAGNVRVQLDPCRDWAFCGGKSSHYSTKLGHYDSGSFFWGAAVAIGSLWGTLYVHLIDEADATTREAAIDVALLKTVEKEIGRLKMVVDHEAVNTSAECEAFDSILILRR